MSIKKENFTFKILYFLGIIFIVAGHADGGGIDLMTDWFKLYSFHLGLFVFCAGYFFVNNSDKNAVNVIKNKIKKFLIPYFIWNLIYGIIITVLHFLGIKFGMNLDLDSLFLKPIYSGHQFVLNLSSWFIIPFFMLEVIGAMFIKYIKKHKNMPYIFFIICMIFGFIGIELAMNGFNTGWWLTLTRLFYFFPFFGLGILYREKLESKEKLNNYIYFTILFVLTLCITYINGGIKSYTPSWCDDFDNIFMPFVLGFIGIAFWLRVSKILVPILKNSKLVNLISKNTFSIMMHHLAGFFVLNCIWALLAYNLDFITGFNFSEFKSTIWYFYLPKELNNFKVIYVVFGISFSMFIKYIEDKVVLLLKQCKNKWK